MDIGETLEVATRAAWRAWLAGNPDAAEIWLVYASKASDIPFVPYDDAVEEALCFGWIDSTVKKVDEHRRAQRFTPRRPGSPVSELNQARVRKLVKQGLMTPRGMAALPDVDAWLEPPPLEIPPDIEAALRAGQAWEPFQEFPEPYRRIRVAFVDQARARPQEFEKRLAHLVRKSSEGKMYGTRV